MVVLLFLTVKTMLNYDDWFFVKIDVIHVNISMIKVDFCMININICMTKSTYWSIMAIQVVPRVIILPIPSSGEDFNDNMFLSDFILFRFFKLFVNPLVKLSNPDQFGYYHRVQSCLARPTDTIRLPVVVQFLWGGMLDTSRVATPCTFYCDSLKRLINNVT